MAAGDLTTLANVRRYMRGEFAVETNTTHDVELERLITAVSADVRRKTGRRLDVPAASIVERRHGDGSARMLLREYPVTAVTAVTVDGTPVPAQVGGTGDGHFLDVIGADGSAVLELAGYTFAKGRGNVSITYTTGWATTPGELEHAVIQLVALAFVDADHIGKSSATINGDAVTWNGGPQLANSSDILAPFIRPSVG